MTRGWTCGFELGWDLSWHSRGELEGDTRNQERVRWWGVEA